MKIDKSKSILNQKCECGRKIDYFQLREHVIAERMGGVRRVIRWSIAIFVIMFIIVNVDFFYGLNELYRHEILGMSMLVGGIDGVLIILSYTFYRDFIRLKKFNAKKSRKAFIRHKVRWVYYHSLGKRQRKTLFKEMGLSIGLAVLPFFMIMVISFIVSGMMDTDLKVVPVIIGLIIYLIAIKLFSKKINKKCKELVISRTAKKGIDFERFNRGVKR